MYDIEADIQSGTEAVDAIVLGAGISGLVSASILLNQGYQRVLIVDEYDHVGGNHIDVQIGEYTFDIGSFIFQDDSPLLRHLPELLPLYCRVNPTWGRLNPQGRVTRYPISIKDDLIASGILECLRILSSVVFARIFRRKLRNARDFAQFWIGARLLHRSGLEHYMERFYGLAPDRIDLSFAEKRMRWIRERASIRQFWSFFRWPKVGSPVIRNRQLARPREGFAYLYQDAVQRLEQNGAEFFLGATLRSLFKRANSLVLTAGERRIRAERVISTIPLDRCLALCGLNEEHNLETVTLMSLFFSFDGNRGFSDSILYNFSHSGSWKRLTVYSDFYGRANGREFFAVEVNADHVAGSIERAAQQFREHIAANSLFAGDLCLEGSRTLANAYPIYTKNAEQRSTKAIEALRSFGVQTIGRQGAFDYQPTAQVTTLKAERALSRG